MPELDEFEPGPLSRIEGQRFRLLWAERMIRIAQMDAWKLWAKIFYWIVGVAGGIATLWTLAAKVH